VARTSNRAGNPAPGDPRPEDAATVEEQPQRPAGRSVDLNRVVHRLKLRAGESEQEAAVLEAMLEEAEAERDRLREENEQLRAELVAATSARAATG
jgi:chromosome segregation ATPase